MTELRDVSRHSVGPAARKSSPRANRKFGEDGTQRSRQCGSDGLEPKGGTPTFSLEGADHHHRRIGATTDQFNPPNSTGRRLRVDQMNQGSPGGNEVT